MIELLTSYILTEFEAWGSFYAKLWAVIFQTEIFPSERKCQFLYFHPEGNTGSVLSFKYPEKHPYAHSRYVICTTLESAAYTMTNS